MAATLASIGLNLCWGLSVTVASCLFFGGIVSLRACNDKIAPRTWARPTQVIQNALHHRKRKIITEDMNRRGGNSDGGRGKLRASERQRDPKDGDGKDGEVGVDDDDEIDRLRDWACYCCAWIPWAWYLSYREMYMGIPGTGTRAGGKSGVNLCTNLDGIILARFQSLCLRVASLATFLCCAFLLPLNLTAGCSEYEILNDEPRCAKVVALTDFGRTTIANIPNLNPTRGTYYTITDDTRLLARLFAVVFVAWILYAYTCAELWKEWIENLVMRRVLYFEQDNWIQRKLEIKYLNNLKDDIDPFQKIRPPWVPDPELRETVPNIALNSVLYELPEAPLDVDSDDDGLGGYCGTSFATKRDWQLAEAAKFFDRCIPNQPGYSSSVAAVTILPEANLLASAWQKWIIAGQKVRRARYIKQLIGERLYELKKKNKLDESDPIVANARTVATSLDIERPGLIKFRLTDYGSHAKEFAPIDELVQKKNKDDKRVEIRHRPSKMHVRIDNEPKSSAKSKTQSSSVNTPKALNIGGQSIATGRMIVPEDLLENDGIEIGIYSGREDDDDNNDDSVDGDHSSGRDEADDIVGKNKGDDHGNDDDDVSLGEPPSPERSTDKTEFGYSQVLGIRVTESNEDMNESESSIYAEFPEFEQTAAYSRAFADSAGGCCPRGHCTWRLRRAGLCKLLDELKDTEDELCEANEALQAARNEVSNFVKGDSVRRKSKMTNSRDIGNIVDNSNQSDTDSESDKTYRLSYKKLDMEIRQRIDIEQQWNKIDTIIGRNKTDPHSKRSKRSEDVELSLPVWLWRGLLSFLWRAFCCCRGITSCSASHRPTYAAVTFTSRQAAIAARQCLADGSALGRWEQLEGIPVAPLADSPSCNICTLYGICKPVTVAISNGEKLARRTLAYLILCFFYFFYTIPLSFASTVFSPEQIEETFPFLSKLRGSTLSDSGSNFLSGAIYSLFFFTCPFIFKAIANFGSGAISVREAEYIALGYYWWFMLLTAFTGNSLTTMVINGFSTGVNIGIAFQEVLISVANVIPNQISAAWISWIIIKTTITMPMNYLCQMSVFLMECLRLKCCSRLSRGKAGGPIPFRIFVDTGVVNLCVMALAPACPLVAPISLLYYLVSNPVLKWSLIFVYRPQYDDGGFRWPQLFNVMISAMVLSQILLTTMLALKKATIPALLAGLSIIPTLYFDLITRRKFMPAYQDAGLLQTSELDGWGESKKASAASREEYRQWVVDCHKASFVPPCLAGADNILTAEPAVVIPLEYDEEMKQQQVPAVAVAAAAATTARLRPALMRSEDRILSSKKSWTEDSSNRQNVQRGVILRRVAQLLLPLKRTLEQSDSAASRQRKAESENLV